MLSDAKQYYKTMVIKTGIQIEIDTWLSGTGSKAQT